MAHVGPLHAARHLHSPVPTTHRPFREQDTSVVHGPGGGDGVGDGGVGGVGGDGPGQATFPDVTLVSEWARKLPSVTM